MKISVNGEKTVIPSIRHKYIIMAVFGVLIITILTYSVNKGTRMTSKYVPLVDAVMVIKLEITRAHLIAEEIMTGDTSEDINELWTHFDRSQWYARAIRDGGENWEWKYIPVENIAINNTMSSLITMLATLRDLTESRLQSIQVSGPGSEVEMAYDDLFNSLILEADNIEEQLRRTLKTDMTYFRIITVMNVIAIVLFFSVVVMIFIRSDSRLKDILIKLNTANEELESFAYTVSHDLKSPIISIAGFARLMEKNINKGDITDIHDDLKHIRMAARKMELRMDNLLYLSKSGLVANPSDTMNINELINEARELLASQLNNVSVTLNISRDLPEIYVDRTRIVEVFQNFLENAIKFCGDQDTPSIEIGATKGNREILCYVRDNGLGIDPSKHSDIFNVFTKLNPELSGSGIGLSIVKKIVEIHKGRVWVESEGIGRGSTFYFTLPLAEA